MERVIRQGTFYVLVTAAYVGGAIGGLMLGIGVAVIMVVAAPIVGLVAISALCGRMVYDELEPY